MACQPELRVTGSFEISDLSEVQAVFWFDPKVKKKEVPASPFPPGMIRHMFPWHYSGNNVNRSFYSWIRIRIRATRMSHTHRACTSSDGAGPPSAQKCKPGLRLLSFHHHTWVKMRTKYSHFPQSFLSFMTLHKKSNALLNDLNDFEWAIFISYTSFTTESGAFSYLFRLRI